jgi:UDP-N-acetylglucosamine/UDP-N-acetylgalactosamine diphosphorylase
LLNLVQRGVEIPLPDTVEIHDSVKLDKIAPGAVINAGSGILGSETSIGPGSVIGAETPARVKNCQLGKSVSLGGGFFSEATFLDKSSMGSGAHVRAGTLLEEEASGAHTVGSRDSKNKRGAPLRNSIALKTTSRSQ